MKCESGFLLSTSESESESSPKNSESGFESESGFGFPHHCLGHYIKNSFPECNVSYEMVIVL